MANSIADSWTKQASEELEELIPRILDAPEHRNSAGSRAITLFSACITHDLVVDLDPIPATVSDTVRETIHRAMVSEFAEAVKLLTGDDAGDSTDELRWLAADVTVQGRGWVEKRARETLENVLGRLAS